LKILIAVHGFPPTHSAGAERRAERMVRWLTAQGHQVTVFTVESLEAPAFSVNTTSDNGSTIHRLSYNVSEGNHFRNLYDFPQIGQAFLDVLASDTFDLVHVVSGYLLGGQVILNARQAGIPVVVTLTEYWFMCARLNLIRATGEVCSGPETDAKCARCLMEDKRRYRFISQSAPQPVTELFWSLMEHSPVSHAMTQTIKERRITLRQVLEAADLVISPSRYLMNKFAEFGFDTQKFVFMRQGLQKPAPDLKPPPEPASSTLTLGYVGQIKYHKGVDLLVDAVIDLLNSGFQLNLELWGSETEEPDYVAALKAHTRAYPSIQWKGRYLGSDVWKVLSGFDTLVIPSRWYENSPNVILEAYETKLPVIGTNLGGTSELIEHGKTGLCFELNNKDDLLQQIKRILQEPGLLPNLRANIPPVKSIHDEMTELVVHYQSLIHSAQGS